MKEIILPVVETHEIGAVISTDNFRFKSSLKLQKKQLPGMGSLLLSLVGLIQSVYPKLDE